MKPRLLFKQADEQLASALAKQLSISKRLARLLVLRNITQVEDARLFLFATLADLPSPFLLADLDKAVQRIIQAITNQEKIVVYGDYDVDGTSSTSLLLLFFQELGCPISFYIPHRLHEGYSLNRKAVTKLLEEGTRVLITVDNGIAAYDDIAFLQSSGCDVIVTDHHEIPLPLVSAFAVINPLRTDQTYPDRTLCGAGVVFNLLMALRLKLREQGFFEKQKKQEPNLKRYLDLVALATVADMVPLMQVNRIFVREGLKEWGASRRPGICALKEVSQLGEQVSAGQLGFRAGPRINAGGRLYDASIGVKLLTALSLEVARPLAKELDVANRERQKIEADIVEQALLQIETDPFLKTSRSLVLWNEEWHPGVVGIVASRLVQKYHRPAVIMGSDGTYFKGSARSVGNFDLVAALRSCGDLLLKCGGHKAAAGLTIKQENLEAFRQQFEKIVAERLSLEDCNPVLKIDEELTTVDLNINLLNEIALLEPHGQKNPAPLFIHKKVSLKFPKIIGTNHLKFQLEGAPATVSAIAFGQGERLPDLKQGAHDLIYQCEKDDYRGGENISLLVKEIN